MKGRVIRRKFLFSRQADLRYSKILAAGKKRPHAAWKPLRLSLRPVSYTHLDVYKRQGPEQGSHRFRRLLAGQPRHLNLAAEVLVF